MDLRKKVFGGLCMLFSLAASAQQTIQPYNLLDEKGELTASAGDDAMLSCLNDKNDNTVYTVPFASTGWLMFKADHPLVVTANVFVPADDVSGAPKRFKLSGSHDGVTWTVLKTVLGATNTARTPSITNLTNSTAYTWFKVELQGITSGATEVKIAEWQLLGYSSPDLADLTAHVTTVTDEHDNTTLNNLLTESPSELYRQNNQDSCWVQYELDEAMPVSGYTLMSGVFSNANMQPRSWELLGSHDGEQWDILDSRFNVNMLAATNNMQVYRLGEESRSYDWGAIADEAHESMINLFWRAYGNGYYLKHGWHPNEEICNNGFNYWWMAHVVDVYIDAYRRTGRADYKTRAYNVYDAMLQYGRNTYGRNDLWNGFFDDMEWMALACMRADETWGNKLVTQWDHAATSLWDWIKVGWSDIYGGGIQWNDQKPYAKNACANAPAAIIAARMYKRTGEEDHLDWAKKLWEWIHDNLVFDNGIVKDSYDQDSWGWTFTYNQGTWIGACMELYDITGEQKYLDAAIKNADYVVNDWKKFCPHGIMVEGGQSDGGLFKGIFIRYMAQWILSGQLDPVRERHYTQWMLEQGKNLWESATLKPEIIFNVNWTDRPARREASSQNKSERYDASIHISSVMLFEMLDLLQREGKFNEHSVSPETMANKDNAYKYYRLAVKSNQGSSNLEYARWQLLAKNGGDGVKTVSVADGCSVHAGNGCIVIENAGDSRARTFIYNTNGGLVSALEVGGTERVAVPAGMYVVKMCGQQGSVAYKVAVK